MENSRFEKSNQFDGDTRRKKCIEERKRLNRSTWKKKNNEKLYDVYARLKFVVQSKNLSRIFLDVRFGYNLSRKFFIFSRAIIITFRYIVYYIVLDVRQNFSTFALYFTDFYFLFSLLLSLSLLILLLFSSLYFIQIA